MGFDPPPSVASRARAPRAMRSAAALSHGIFRVAFERALDDVAESISAIARAVTTTNAAIETPGANDDPTATTCADALRSWTRFRARYANHTRAEDEVLFPTIATRIDNVTNSYEFEHEAEEWLFAEVTTTLELCARMGERDGSDDDASTSVRKAARIAHATRTTLKAHLQKESEHVVPLVERAFDRREQGEMVWGFVSALGGDLGSVERVKTIREMLEWAAKTSDDETVDALERELGNAADGDAAAALRRAFKGTERDAALKVPILRALFTAGQEKTEEETGQEGASGRVETHEPARKRRRQAAGTSGTTTESEVQKMLPIDHIFQFHGALRNELARLEHDILAISSTGTAAEDGRLVRMIDARFVFLRGVYEAHSKSEDDIVFPALEAKSALHNVSHAYTLDHQQEATLIATVVELIAEMRSSVMGETGSKKGFREGLVSDIQQACVAMRVSLETHVAKEESELWPLFEKHFSFEEQEKIVGKIIGRTGAEVLRSMLMWVRGSMNDDQREGMISSVRHATQNTRFAQWMNTWYSGKDIEPAGDDWVKDGEVKADAIEDAAKDGMQQVHAFLSTRKGEQNLDKETFRPGWEDIFRMNQIQLEDAVRAVNRDDTIEPTKKAYLIQNLLASRWIVGNQLQAQKDKSGGGDSAPSRICEPVEAGAVRKDGCRHYKRRCQIVAPCCNQAFTCRFCHDDASDHTVNRYAVKEMICTECSTRQPVNDKCVNCSTVMAKYHCRVCNLFDNSSVAIYHCPFCNVCRRGKGLGVDFFHCMNCNACVSLQHGKHECSERGMDSECPVCKEFLADSETPVKELPCGHLMHATCFATYTRHYYTCPLCRKSLGDFSVYFRMLDAILADESDDGTPESVRDKTQRVLCNDCGKESDAKFHFVYHACAHCRSYNTRVLTY